MTMTTTKTKKTKKRPGIRSRRQLLADIRKLERTAEKQAIGHREALSVQESLRDDTRRLFERTCRLENLVWTMIPQPDRREPMDTDVERVFVRGVKATIADIDRDTPGGYGPNQGGPPKAMSGMDPGDLGEQPQSVESLKVDIWRSAPWPEARRAREWVDWMVESRTKLAQGVLGLG